MAETDTRLRYDGVETYLANPLVAGSNLITFTSPLMRDGGLPVETLNADEYLVLTILDENYVLDEILYLTDYKQGETTGYVDRAMEGTRSENHAANSKVVHAPTALDFISVQEHDKDPHAHYDEMLAIAQAESAKAVEAHVEESNPHDQYQLKDDIVYEDGLIIPDGATLLVQPGGTIELQPGSDLIVYGTLTITGRLIVNGHEIFVGRDEPDPSPANAVWIKTFGG
jgi:hypothetical protein